jgi:hypothetical protein
VPQSQKQGETSGTAASVPAEKEPYKIYFVVGFCVGWLPTRLSDESPETIDTTRFLYF